MSKLNLKKHLTGKQKETAIEAVQRYEQMTHILASSSDELKIEMERNYQLVYHFNNWHYQLDTPEIQAAFMKEKLEATEQKYGIKLPDDYKQFMIEKGPFQFGRNDLEFRVLYPPLSETIMDVAVSDDYFESKEEAMNYGGEEWDELQQRIVFIKGRDDFNYFSFNLGSFHPKGISLDILDTCQDDWFGFKVSSSFDQFIRKALNERIECMLDDLEIEI